MIPSSSRPQWKKDTDALKIHLQKIVDDRKEEMKSHKLTIVDPKLPSDFEKMSYTEIHYYVQGIKLETDALREMINSNILWRKSMYGSEEIWEARIIIKHWKNLQDHLEKNPSIKEEWEALLMAIKLTEDE